VRSPGPGKLEASWDKRVRRVDEIAPRLARLSLVYLPGRTGVEVTLNRRVDRADIDDATASVTSVIE